MRRDELDRVLAEELARIPERRALYGRPLGQSVFRMMYSSMRRSDLARDPRTPRSHTLRRALRLLGEHASFVPTYDAGYFGAA